jgi:hypothetical protein
MNQKSASCSQGPAFLPAEKNPRCIRPAAKQLSPIGPVGREAFRFAAEGSAFGFTSREMSLGSPDRNVKTASD